MPQLLLVHIAQRLNHLKKNHDEISRVKRGAFSYITLLKDEQSKTIRRILLLKI
jgi:hypothetical protein